MANQVILDKSKLTAIGNAIRSKTGGTSNLTADQMASEITDKMLVPTTTKGATTYTPTTSNQTIASGTYLTGTQTIKGDSNLVAGNIKKGVSIFGVNGTYDNGIEGVSINESGTLSIDDTETSKVDLILVNGEYHEVHFYGENNEAHIENYTDIYVSNNCEIYYTSGTVTTTNLKATNIKKGVSILGVTGTYETPIDLDDITTMSWQQLSELSSKGVDLSGCLGQTKQISVSGSTINARLVSIAEKDAYA